MPDWPFYLLAGLFALLYALPVGGCVWLVYLMRKSEYEAHKDELEHRKFMKEMEAYRRGRAERKWKWELVRAEHDGRRKALRRERS